MRRTKTFERCMYISGMVFLTLIVIAFFLTGMLYALTCDALEIATSIVANTICGSVAFLIAVNCLQERKHDKSMRVFTMAAWSTFGFIILDFLGWITLSEQSPSLLQYFVDAAEVLTGYLVTMLFTCYVRELTGEHHHWMALTRRILYGLCVLAVLSFLITLPIGLPFSIINRTYVRGSLYPLFQIIPAIVVLVNLLFVCLDHKTAAYEKLSLSIYCLAPLIALPIQAANYGIAATSVSLLISLVIVYNNVYLQHGRALENKEQELTTSRINMMVSQIQPHFLFNTLTSIANICEKDPNMARQAIVDFSDYLRVNLDSLKCNQTVPFEKEMEHCRTYLRFEKMRFEEELNAEIDIRASDFKIPILSVQPLLENAVKYGICKKPGGGTVRLSTYRRDGRIYVEVSDDGIGFDLSAAWPDDSRQHIGLENVQFRIRQMCNGEMTIESTPGIGTKVTISLPEKGGDAT